MFPRGQMIALDHQLLTMRELGKFHGVALAMKDQRPEEFNEFKQIKDIFIKVLFRTKFRTFLEKCMERAINALEDPEHKKIMQDLLESHVERLDRIKDDEHCDEFGVMAHSDCWNNNMLFQYSNDDKKQLQSMVFVDWQVTHYCPPVIDLFHNIFSSTDKPFRDEHYETLLRTYHQSLSDIIRKLGSDPDKLYSWEDLQMQMVKYSDYALSMAPFSISIMVAKAKNVRNVDEYSEMLQQDGDVDLIGEFDEETQKEFSRQINGLLTDLVNYGYVEN